MNSEILDICANTCIICLTIIAIISTLYITVMIFGITRKEIIKINDNRIFRKLDRELLRNANSENKIKL